METSLTSSWQPNVINWQTAIESNQPWLRKVLRCRVGDGHAVDDLMQEIALAVFRQADHSNANTEKQSGTVPDDPNKVAPWLYQLAVRQAANFHRRANRKSEPKATADLDHVVATTQSEPLDWLLQTEKCNTLETAIEKLEIESREILMLKYTENWSYKQLAQRLGLTEKAVEHRLAKARKLLRQNLHSSLLDD